MSGDLAGRLYFAAIHLLRRLRRADETLEVSLAELSAIATLVRSGPMTLSELAAAEQVQPPTVTRLVQRLEAGGFLIKEPAPDDGRVSIVRHTAKAWTTLEAAAAGRARALAGPLATLSPDDLATLERAVELLERLATAPEPADIAG